MRHFFQTKLDETDDVIIYNPLSIDWSSFPYDFGYKLHRITQIEILKPYLIPLQYYGNTEYEDIILLLNNIENIFEVVPEKQIKIPDYTELQTWLGTKQTNQ